MVTFFLAASFLTSLYHILIIIPTILLFKSGLRIKIPKSGWFLLALVVWVIICNTVNISELQNARKSYDDVKFCLFGVLLILPLQYFYERVKEIDK